LVLTQSNALEVTAVAVDSKAIATTQTDGAVQYKLFLKEKFDVGFKEKITKGDFIEAIATSLNYVPSGEEVTFSDLSADHALFSSAVASYEHGVLSSITVQSDNVLTNANAIYMAVRAAGLKELAYTYPAKKADKVLAKSHVKSSGLATKSIQEIAVAVDLGLLPAELSKNLKLYEKASDELVYTLLGNVVKTQGLYKKYLGYTNDAEIYTKLNNAYKTSDIIDAPKLQTLVNEALKQELITGYNLKDSRFDPNFIDSLSLKYGHSDISHAIQLIGLLRSEGIHAKVQFEPKTSAYIHLAEWGDPGPNVVKIENGNFINYSKEYDLGFEFTNVKDKVAFESIVMKYAKKDEADQAGLIYGAWWQPLFFSKTKMDNYEVITNNFIADQDSTYTVHPFSLNEDSAKVIEGFEAIDPSVEVTPIQFWVDKPFFRYLHGEGL